MRYLEQENKKLLSTVSAIQNDMQYLRQIQQTEKGVVYNLQHNMSLLQQNIQSTYDVSVIFRNKYNVII